MNLPDLLTELGIDFKRHGESPHVSNGWLGLICPFCGIGTGKYGCGVNIDNPYAVTCYKCGKKKIGEVLSEITGKSVRECLSLLRGIAPLPSQECQPTGRLRIPDGVGPLQPIHEKYLRQRKFDPGQLVRLWGIQGIGLASRLAWRLFIPVCNRDGKTVSWTTRAVTDDTERRYINARPEEESVPIKHTLYGWHHVRQSVVICEGPFDAMRIGPGAVATFGLNVTAEQLALLIRPLYRTILFDSEPEAQRRAQKLCDELSMFPGETYRVELDADDPGSASDKEIRLLRRTFLD